MVSYQAEPAGDHRRLHRPFAERVSGKQLDDLFNAWLYTPGKPADPRPAPATSADPAVVARVAASGESTDDPVPHRRR